MNKFINLKYFFKNQLNSNEHHEVVDFKQSFDIDKNKWSENKKLAICIGFNPWKRDFFNEFVSDYNLAYVRGKTHHKKVIEILKSIKEKYKVFIWSYKEDPEVYKFLVQNNIEISRVEDGFIRSIGLGADKVPPLSLVIDDDGIYFDPNSKSKLIKILEEVSNNITEEQKQKARDTINFIVKNGISKYNLADNVELPKELIEKIKIKSDDTKVVLVVGQVGDDESIIRGSSNVKDSATLVEIARKENQNAIILYRPHPDVWYKKREESIDLSYISTISTVVPPNVSLNSMWDIVDVVYTITSLTGFEALLRNKHVVCFGLPFYSGYGLTEDRIEHPHRNLKLDLETFFYAAYIKYPHYINGDIYKTLLTILEDRKILPYSVDLTKFMMIVLEDEIKTINISDFLQINNISQTNIAFIGSKSDVKPLAYLSGLSKVSCDFVALSLVVENKVNEKFHEAFREIYNLERRYMTTHSEIEYKVFELSGSLEKEVEVVLIELFKKIFFDASKDLISAMLKPFRDRLTKPFSHYFSLIKLFSEYDTVILYIDDLDDAFLNTYLSLSKYNNEKKKIILMSDNILKDKLEELVKNPTSQNQKISNISFTEIENSFLSYWNEINTAVEKQALNKFKELLIPVCIQMHRRPYAYYPAGKEIVEAISKMGYGTLLIPSNYLDRPNIIEEMKTVADEDGLTAGGSIVYNINEIKSQPIVKSSMLKLKKAEDELYLFIKEKLCDFFPHEIVFLTESSIKLFCEGIKNRLLFIADINQVLKTVPVTYMTPERPEMARILAVLSKYKNIPSVSVQHVMISDSPRYDSPIVSNLGVMDTLQRNVYVKLGYPIDKIKLTGSANLRLRHQWIIDSKKFINDNNHKPVILFGMQHSTMEQMISIYHLLKESLEHIDALLFIKPHPVQEEKLLEYIRKDIGKENSKIFLKDKTENTYDLIVNSNIVVGLFSNVLLEAAVFADKRVLIITDEISDSIDLSLLGLAKKVTMDINIVKNIILDFLADDTEAKNLDHSRYLFCQENSHLFNQQVGVDFIQSFLVNQKAKLAKVLFEYELFKIKSSKIFHANELANFEDKYEKSTAFLVLQSNSETIKIINSTNFYGDVITVGYLTDQNIKNDCLKEDITIKNLDKMYMSINSQVEIDSYQMAKIISSHLHETLIILFSDIFSRNLAYDISSALLSTFSENITKKLIQYFSLLKIIKEYKCITLLVDNVNDPFVNLFIELSKQYNKDTDCFLLAKKETMTNIQSILSREYSNNIFTNEKNLNQLKIDINSYWYDLKSITIDNQLYNNKHHKLIPLCMFMNDNTSAYYSSGKEIAQAISFSGYRPLLIPISYISSLKSVEEWKRNQIDLIKEGALVYDMENSKLKISNLVVNNFQIDLYNLLRDELYKLLPNYLAFLLEVILKRFSMGIIERLIFISNMDNIIDGIPAVFVSPDRAELSQIVVSIANSKKIESVSIQHMTISDSPRYTAPSVSNLGVIDTMQKNIFLKLGYPENQITLVGSANLRNRSKWINECQKSLEIISINKIIILFPLQHSTLKQMKKIYDVLKKIVLSMDAILLIKPHPSPSMEESLLKEIENDTKTYYKDKIILEEKTADTYKLITKSNIIVGLYSQVLYEAAFFANKRVIIVSDEEITETVDYSVVGLAVKVFPEEKELLRIIKEMILNESNALSLDNRREKYQLENKHLYDLDAGKNFIKSFLNLRNENNE